RLDAKSNRRVTAVSPSATAAAASAAAPTQAATAARPRVATPGTATRAEARHRRTGRAARSARTARAGPRPGPPAATAESAARAGGSIRRHTRGPRTRARAVRTRWRRPHPSAGRRPTQCPRRHSAVPGCTSRAAPGRGNPVARSSQRRSRAPNWPTTRSAATAARTRAWPVAGSPPATPVRTIRRGAGPSSRGSGTCASACRVPTVAHPRRPRARPPFFSASTSPGSSGRAGNAADCESTSRNSLWSMPASGLQKMRANIWPESRSTSTIRATANPGGYVPSSPDVTISDAQIRRRRGETQLGRAAGAVAEEHAARAAALDLDGNRLVAIGEQRHFGHVGKYARHLADDAVFIDHARACLDAGARALVDEDLLRERITARVEHLHGDRSGDILRAHVEQRAQSRILVLLAHVALRRRCARDEFLPERRILVRHTA